MAKEINVSCDFLMNQLTCELPEHTMDVVFKGENKNRGAYIWRRCVHMHTKGIGDRIMN